MANRYCNLVGSKKISEDFQNINIGFDAVQQDMDSKSSGDHRHPNATDTTDGFMSAQDKAKMDASTASATPGTLVQRDASGRMKAAAPSAKTDVARKAEVDAVQADLDEHKADAVMHVTEADHEKLGSIEEGAEVNQPAFSRVNDIEAGEKTDALTFKGGVGIKVTTNPTTKEVTFTATGDSTPGAHGSSHTEHGSDPIPNATAKEGGLMSAADKAEHDKIAPEVPKHSEQLKEHTAELEDHEQRIEDVETGLADVPGTPLELQPGLRVVETEQDTPFRMGEIKGRTLLNLNGKEGNFDYRGLLPTFFGTGEIIPSSGPISTKAMKVVCNRTDTAHFGARYELNIDRSKHYIAVAYMDNVSCDAPVYFSIAEMKDTGYTSLRLSAKIAKGSGMQYLYATIDPARMENREKLVYYFRGEGTSGAEFRIGPFAFYEITAAEYDAIAKMTPEQVAEKYPYVDSMTNVKNPYAIVTGGNLLPPFTDGWSIASQARVVSPYHLLLSPESNYNGTYVSIPCVGNTTYTLQGTVTGGGKLYADVRGTNDSHEYHLVENGSVTFTATADAMAIDVLCTNDTTIAGNMEFINVMLTIGTEPKPFTPQQRSMLAFETELAAHPVDGSNPDTLFMGDDGLPYVLEPWGKVTLDGNMKYLLAHNGGDFRTFFTETLPPTVKDTAYVTKYDGKMLARRLLGQSITEGDTQVLTDSTDVNPNRSVFSVFNTDSGWGPDYKLTEDDIKAYFLGWKMFDNSTNGDGTGVYNRTDGQHKAWTPLDSFNGTVYSGVYSGAGTPKELPSTENTTFYVKNRPWQPYRLQYLKAKPTVEPVRNYEMGATLSAGSNMVEVGSGIVIREKANPVVNYINAINAAGGRLKYRTTRLLAIYRNQARDFGWTFKDNIWNGEPYQYAEHPIPALANAVYHVTYTMLDPTLAAPISGTVAANLRGTVSDLVQDVGDVQRRLSVVENSKAEAVEDTGWIKVTPMSGWQTFTAIPFRFRVIGNRLLLRGAIQDGPTSSPTQLFTLPIKVHSTYNAYFGAVTWGAGTVSTANCLLQSGGTVSLNSGTAGKYISFDGIEFLIDGLEVKKS